MSYSDASRDKLKRLKFVNDRLEEWHTLEQGMIGLENALSMEPAELEVLQEDLLDQIVSVEKTLSQLEFWLYLSGVHDSFNAIFEIHVGNGGDDAEDFVSMLTRMYMRFFERKEWTCAIIDQTESDVGIKSIVLQVEGEYVYGQLKEEQGVHRLIRLSPFKATDSRQTSFASVIVTPIFEDSSIAIREEDLKIDTYRSSGAGGQKVNKTDSAVRITHIPSGIVVQCQTERSQLQNKQRALMILRSKLSQAAEERMASELKNVRGELKKAEFGSQIRTFTLQPYKLVKDHRTGYEETNVDRVLDGNVEPFIQSALASHAQKP